MKECGSQKVERVVHNGLIKSDKAKAYFKSRGIEIQALKDFSLGYSENMDMLNLSSGRFNSFGNR